VAAVIVGPTAAIAVAVVAAAAAAAAAVAGKSGAWPGSVGMVPSLP
jgi:hypothetical protein